MTLYGVNGAAQANVKRHLSELEQLKPLTQFKSSELNEQIIKALEPYGYFKAKVSIGAVTKHKLSATISLGPQIKITKLDIQLTGEGAHYFSLKDTLNNSALKLHTPFETNVYNKAKQSLLETAENNGFMHARFKKNEVLIDLERYTVEITLIFDTGPLYYFGQIDFNPTTINPDLLHRFVPFKPGEIYSGDKILELNNDLSSSGYFSSVLVKPEITDSVHVPVKIHLDPVSKYSYTVGAGYGTDTGIRGRAAVHIIPVNRQGHKFNALVQGSMVQNALQAQYVIPGMNPITDQYTITGNYSNLNYSAGSSNAWLLSLAQQHTTKNYKRVYSINSLYEGFHYTLQPDNKQFLLYPRGNWTFSKTEGLLFSPSGFNISLNALGASTATLSTLNYAQGSIDVKAALKIESIRLRLYGHAIQGLIAVDNILHQPVSLAILLGGMDNLKAYSFNSIGPGRVISYAGFELQKETKKNWYVLGFIDAGDVYNPTPVNFQYDAGVGLMWVSPIGPVKIGVAQPFNSQWHTEKHSPRLVISMGPDL